MNISLRQVFMDVSQTMFITSTGIVLFTAYSKRDLHGYRSTSVITSIDDQGSIVQVGHINWNEHTENEPSLSVRTGRMELRNIMQDGISATIFRGSDGLIYRWKKATDAIVLSADSAPLAPIAIAYEDAHSFSTAGETAQDLILCVRPTGFHLLHEVVATFILFEQLCRHSGARAVLGPRRGTRIFPGEPRIQLTKFNDSHWTRTQHASPTRLYDPTGRYVPYTRTLHRCSTRSTADLTGALLRRHKYPSAYGGFGDIWKCDWLKDARVIQVAVKVMRTNLTGIKNDTVSKRISRELKIWMRLEHECVLPLYGINFDFGAFPAMVCPWIEGGTLSKYLEHHEELPLHTRLQLLSDIAEGLQYREIERYLVWTNADGVSQSMDAALSTSNVLIKDNGKACLSDFGLSRIFTEATGSCYWTSTIRGSVRWAAPELFVVDEEVGEGEGEDSGLESVPVLPTPQSDIYSFGSTMLQVLTGKVPYHYYTYDAQVLVALSRGLRPVRPDAQPVDDAHWAFMQWCWAARRTSGSGRPSVEEVVDFLAGAR